MAGIKETRDALIALNDLAAFLVTRLRDGADLSDAFALYSKITSDGDFQAKMVAMIEGIEKIPAEISDLDINEIIELGSLQLSFLPSIVKAITSDDST